MRYLLYTVFENLSKSLIFRDFYFELLSLAKKVDFLVGKFKIFETFLVDF